MKRKISELPRVNDTVYELCDQDSALVWGELPKDWMPDDQLLIVWIFRWGVWWIHVDGGLDCFLLSTQATVFFGGSDWGGGEGGMNTSWYLFLASV